MPQSLPGAFIAFLAGALAAYVNYRVSAKAARTGGALFSFLPVLRMLADVGVLLAAWFLAPCTPWDRVWLLAGAAAGLTLPMFVFTVLLARRLDRRDPPSEENKSVAERDTNGPEQNDSRPEGGDQT